MIRFDEVEIERIKRKRALTLENCYLSEPYLFIVLHFLDEKQERSARKCFALIYYVIEMSRVSYDVKIGDLIIGKRKYH